MTCHKIPCASAICLTLLVLLLGDTAALAQNTPEMREVLTRLDRLEKDNQALTHEIRALRLELARLSPAGATAEVASSDGPALEDDQPTGEELRSVEQSRIQDLAQTKVEASQKFPIRVTGMALFNAYVNGRYNNQSNNPTVASLGQGDATGGGTLRQSTLGLLFNGPGTFAGGKISGSLYMDFFGGSTSALNHVIRLRTASVHLDWNRTSLLAGQEKPIISPRDPDSLAQVGVSPLTGAGNLWLWQPQVRVEQRIGLGNSAGLRAQVGLFQTSLLNNPSDPYSYAVSAPGQLTEDSNPGLETRLEAWKSWGETGRIEVAGGFHVNRNHIFYFSLPSNIYTLDWFVRPFDKLEFSGMFFHGRNVAVLGGLRQGYAILPGGKWISVASNGGWAQLRLPVTSRLTFDVYGGQQDDHNADLVTGFIAKNQAYFANAMYRLAPNVIVSLEGGQVRTSYFRIGNRLNDHYDVGIAYLF